MSYAPIPEGNIKFLHDEGMARLLHESAVAGRDIEQVVLYLIRVRRGDSEAGAVKGFFYQFLKDAQDGLNAEPLSNRITPEPRFVDAYLIDGRYYVR